MLYEIWGIDANEKYVLIDYNVLEHEVDNEVKAWRRRLGMEHVFWKFQEEMDKPSKSYDEGYDPYGESDDLFEIWGKDSNGSEVLLEDACPDCDLDEMAESYSEDGNYTSVYWKRKEL